MSMGLYTYVGAFVKCVNPITKTPIMATRCENPLCMHYREKTGGPFCSMCGNRAGMFQAGEKVELAVDNREVSEAIDQDLFAAVYAQYNNGFDVWLPNKGHDAGIYSHDTEGITENLERLRAEHIRNMTDHYMDAITEMRKRYGSSKVTIEWGMVVYVN